MKIPSIDDVKVKDPAAWVEAITKIAELKSTHFFQTEALFPEGVGQDLVESIVKFAVTAQNAIERGQEFRGFAKELMRSTVVWLGNGAVYGTCDLLRKHWIYGDEIGSWYDAGFPDA